MPKNDSNILVKLLSKIHDPAFNVIDKDPNFIPPEAISDVAPMQEEGQQLGTNEMTKIQISLVDPSVFITKGINR
ncbi:hypothetical protein V6N11_075087 [Hibiscus sabdariffa]|uniref:Uncharacterized protein n=1 Tax=Hibiscus sabdariffa TaxID=183260 RepID=A0ABR2R5K8_9ROSI